MQKITKAIVKSTVLIKKKIVINELYLLWSLKSSREV
jgi:hypothetical protein